MGNTILKFDSVSFSYNSRLVLSNINMSVQEGEIRAIIGPNGGGKSTLLKLALGLLKKHDGNIEILNSKVENFNSWSEIGYVPQFLPNVSYSLYPARVEEVVLFGRYSGNIIQRLFNRKARKSKMPWDDVIAITGIEKLLRQQFHSLSPGERQRVLLACALMKSPKLMLLDEPVSSIDISIKKAFSDMLVEINRLLGVTIVIVTHDIGDIHTQHFTCACLNCSMSFDGPASQLSNEILSSVYGCPVNLLEHDPAV